MMLDASQRPVHLGLQRTVDAAVEPITLDEAKTWLQVSGASEDGLIETLIATARQQVENDTSLALISQTWTCSLDAEPYPSRIVLPIGPVQSVTSIKSVDTANAESTVATTVYRVDTASLPARIVRNDGQSCPTVGRP